MKFREELSWILDKMDMSIYDEEKYKLNIDFVHSLGKKCDCVGWSTLKMDEPDSDVILDKIQKFCKEDGWRARGWYERTYSGESDWYELVANKFKDSTVADVVQVPTDYGKDIYVIVIKAFHELIPAPKEYYDICVPERFRNACIKNGISNVDFCWVKDKGKYQAEQYFNIYPQKLVSRVCCDKGLEKNNKARINALGGKLPRIADVVGRLDNISLPDCYLKEDLPAGGIAYVYCTSTSSYNGSDAILIHKDTAEILINEKVLSWKNLKPVPVLDACPDGYVVDKTKPKPKPNSEYIERMLVEYEKLKKKERPICAVSEKDVLKVFRKIKTERKEDFKKRITKFQIESVIGTNFEPILPYYQIANGGQLSDEYELLSYNEAVNSTDEFLNELKSEEFLENIPQGVVFAKCTDGDAILLKTDGTVIRFSHEAPEKIDEWKNIAQFIFDAITESEQ